MTAILGAHRVTVMDGERPIVSDATLVLEAGERLALVGPNGAGKSTLLRVLTGVLEPRHGCVLLRGAPIGDVDYKSVARTIAVVPELTTLPFAMPVHEVVALGRLPHDPPIGGSRADDRDAVDAAMERVGVAHLRDRDARRLSLGERQLVFVALALAQEAPILILDEPTAHLDIRHQVEVMQLLADLNERDDRTIVAVLHDLALAANFFPRIALMNSGRIVADGPPADTLDAAHIRAVFGVDPALVRLPAGSGPA
jgi:iron complex transport system ATP-binding protein